VATNSTLAGLAKLGLGAALMYLFDPQQGRRRRHQLRDKATHTLKVERDLLGKAGRDVSNRARGVKAVLSSHQDQDLSDEVVAERVRARLGRTVSHPGSIEVDVHGGVATLRGPVLADEVKRLRRKLMRVPGVRQVDSRLEIHGRDDRHPGLQGTGLRRTRRWPMREVWAPIERFAAGSAGAALILGGLRGGRVLRLATTAAGIALIMRSVANEPLRRVLGLDADHEVSVEKTVLVNAPIDEVYALWRRFDQFPRFLQHVRRVTFSGPEGMQSHWEVDGPAGMPLAFDAEITRVEPGKRIEWRTLPDQRVAHDGRVTFEPVDGGTRVHVRLHFAPPAGAVGQSIAHLFGWDPKTRIDHDMIRMKALLEQGRTRAHGERVTLGELRDPTASGGEPSRSG